VDRETKPPSTDRGVKVVGKLVSEINPSVDWLTATVSQNNNRTGYNWLEMFWRMCREDDPSLFQVDQWKNLGYEGVRGDNLSWGFSPKQGYIIIAAGDMAERLWREIRPVDARITRLDLSVTVYTDQQINMLPKAHYDAVPADFRRIGYTLWENKKGGNTLYVGSQGSDQFGRVYDKSAQLGRLPGRIHRYEVQLRKKFAGPMFRQLWADAADQLSALEGIQGYVWSWFDGRMLTPIFSPRENRYRTDKEVRIRTVDRRLAWLRSQVSPTVKKLVDTGHLPPVLEALGLSDLLTD